MDLSESKASPLDPEVLDRFVFTRYFGLTPSNINDALYNIVVKSWEAVVADKFLPAVESSSPEAKDAFKVTCMKKIFMDGKLVIALDQITKYLFSYAMRVPRTMTLPQDLPQLKKPNDEKEILKRLRKTQKEIMDLEEELHNLTYEADSYEKANAVMDVIVSLK
uniref:DNA-directed RNA polymerase III subunit RPC3 n=1 Tax=Steinernema glaseri TaxID=37863 RepID=A0A1I8ARZ4_9BILA